MDGMLKAKQKKLRVDTLFVDSLLTTCVLDELRQYIGGIRGKSNCAIEFTCNVHIYVNF